MQKICILRNELLEDCNDMQLISTHSLTLFIQLFRERLSYKWGKAYTTMSKVIMGNDVFYSCLSEPQGVSAWWKVIEQKRVLVVSHSLLLNHLEPQSSKAKLLLPIMPINIVT